LKDLRAALDKKTRGQYSKLTDGQCVELLLNRKWYRTIVNGIYALYTAVSHRIADRVMELNERYEVTLPALEAEVAQLENKVKSHLERMGFVW
jgi:type I restriction enzyme M protein